jgi:probable O-glycosylation ligase (exosortase A-associated)
MLRTIFVVAIVLAGLFYSIQGPFNALLFYFWLAYFRPESWIWSDFLTQFNLSYIVGLFIVVASLPFISRFRLTWRVGLLLLFLLQSSISLFFSEHPDWSWIFWLEFAKVIVIATSITFLVSDEKRYRMALLVIALSLGFETAKQGWAQFMLNPGATNANPHASLGDNNGVAVGVLMLIPVFVALAQTSARLSSKVLYRFFIGGLVYRAISTYSRGGFLAGGVLGLLMLWRSPRKIRALIATGVVVFAIYSVMPKEYWDRMETIRSPEEERESSAAGRVHFWRIAVVMADAKPFTGVGFNAFRQSFATYNDDPVWGTDRAAHSAWFATLGDMGYPGLILFVGGLLGALFACGRINKRARLAGQKNIAMYAANMQASLLVYVTGATFLSAQYSELLWHMIAMSIALERIQAEAPVEVAAPVTVTAPALPPRAAASFSRP